MQSLLILKCVFILLNLYDLTSTQFNTLTNLLYYRHKPQHIQFIFESSRFFCQAGELIISVLNFYQLLLQLLTVDPIVILSSLQPRKCITHHCLFSP